LLYQYFLLFFLFEYRDGHLFWACGGHGIQKGKIAESIDRASGYFKSVALKRRYLTHRLIFLWHHGYLPKYIDHDDGDSLNNRIENLRECTQSQNMCNSKLSLSNTSGFKGVFWNKRAKKWQVQIGLNSKNIHIGYFSDKNEAIEACIINRKRIHGEFANNG